MSHDAEHDSSAELGHEPVEHHTYCRFCISLCGLVVTTQADWVVKVVGDRAHPVTKGYTCPKGRALGHFHHHPDRLESPRLQDRAAGSVARTVDWDTCLDDLAERVVEIVEQSGPDAVGMYLATASAFDSAGRRAAERFLRALGSRSKYTTATIDTACKPLVAELMTGYPGLVPSLDRDGARLVLLLGTNPVVSHGHFNAMPMPAATLKELANRGEVWVVDPRRTETARLGTRHLAVRPGTDYAVLAHLIRELLRDGADRSYLAEHASGVEELAAAVEPYDAGTAAERAGLTEAELADLLATVRRYGRLAGQTGTGTTMSATANVTEWLLWALHVVTGSYDRPGGMWFNPGFLKRLDERARGNSNGVADPGPPSRPDLVARWGEYPCAALSDEIDTGHLRALFVIGGNPVTSFPETDRVVPSLAAIEVLAVLDVLDTDTTALATHVLPCTGQLERADLPVTTDQYAPVVSSQLTGAVVRPAADRKPMWWVMGQLGKRLGIDCLPEGIDLDTATDLDVIGPIAERGRAGLAAMTDAPSGLVHSGAVFGWVTDRLLPEGRWKLAPTVLVVQLGGCTDPPPLVLVPRRQLRHLNSQLRDGSGPTGQQRDAPTALVHPADAAEAGVADGDRAELVSAVGRLRITVAVDDEIRRGAVSVPHGFAAPNVSVLTSGRAGVDPLTGMVLQSGIPVSLRR